MAPGCLQSAPAPTYSVQRFTPALRGLSPRLARANRGFLLHGGGTAVPGASVAPLRAGVGAPAHA